MKRREFIRIAAMTTFAAAATNPLNLAKAQDPPTRPQGPPRGMPPGGFPPQAPVVYEPTGPGIHVKFLGTGGADWNGPADSGELRPKDPLTRGALATLLQRASGLPGEKG